jgi:predicted outer membrane repeat protein
LKGINNFTSNYAESHGGAIAVKSGEVKTGDKTIFKDNYAKEYGNDTSYYPSDVKFMFDKTLTKNISKVAKNQVEEKEQTVELIEILSGIPFKLDIGLVDKFDNVLSNEGRPFSVIEITEAKNLVLKDTPINIKEIKDNVKAKLSHNEI